MRRDGKRFSCHLDPTLNEPNQAGPLYEARAAIEREGLSELVLEYCTSEGYSLNVTERFQLIRPSHH